LDWDVEVTGFGVCFGGFEAVNAATVLIEHRVYLVSAVGAFVVCWALAGFAGRVAIVALPGHSKFELMHFALFFAL